jgi:hypothetical protein
MPDTPIDKSLAQLARSTKLARGREAEKCRIRPRQHLTQKSPLAVLW